MNLKMSIWNPAWYAYGMILVGLLGITGWIIHSRTITTIFPKGVTIAPVSAFLFILLGISLILSLKEKNDTRYTLVKHLLLIPVIFMGIWTIFDLVTGNPAHIDWKIHPPENLFWLAPESSISPVSALLFIGLAAGIFGWRGSSTVALWIAIMVIISGGFLILGYISGGPFLYGGEIKPVSFLSACGFILSGAGLLTSAISERNHEREA